MSDLPAHLIDLQRAAHQAWDAVEAHRKQVDTARRAAAGPAPELAWQRPQLRPWTGEENARYRELHAAAVAAQAALRAAVDEAGLGHHIDVVQGLHRAARDQ